MALLYLIWSGQLVGYFLWLTLSIVISTTHTTITLHRLSQSASVQCGLLIVICYALHQLHIPNKEEPTMHKEVGLGSYAPVIKGIERFRCIILQLALQKQFTFAE